MRELLSSSSVVLNFILLPKRGFTSVPSEKRPRILPVSCERVLFLPMLPAWCIAPYLSLIVVNPLPLSRLLQAPLLSAPVRVVFSWFSIFFSLLVVVKGLASRLLLFAGTLVWLSCSLSVSCQWALWGTIRLLSAGGLRRRRGLRSCGADQHTCTRVAVAPRRWQPHTRQDEHTKKEEKKKEEGGCSLSRTLQVFFVTLLFLVLSPPFCCLICLKSGPAQVHGSGQMRKHSDLACLSACGGQSTRQGEMWLWLHPPSAHSWDWEQTQHAKTQRLPLPPSNVALPRWGGRMTVGANEWARGERKRG